MTDNAYLLRILKDGNWHSRDEILAYSMAERGCGITVHSRASDLRKQGYAVACDVRQGARRQSFYRLVAGPTDG